MGKSNPYASNPVDPMINGFKRNEQNAPDGLAAFRGDTSNRPQTVLTPPVILDPIREFFGGEIGYDPCHAEDSLVNAREVCHVPWDQVWARALEIAQKITVENDMLSGSPNVILQLVRSEIRASSVPKNLRAKLTKAAKEVKETLRSEFAHMSGHYIPFKPKTFVNPPFGNRGPETVLANFKDFCAAFARSEVETIMLSPSRSNRDWWCCDVFGAADAVTMLPPIKFHGWEQAFPAPLVLAYKSGAEHWSKWPRAGDRSMYVRSKVAEYARAVAHIGRTYTNTEI